MASEDVIELGSSEDEAEPAPKKIRPTPNAMVHIPGKLPNVTVKPVASKIGLKVSPAAKLAGKGITVTKVSPNAKKNSINIVKSKPNGRNGMPSIKPNPIGLMTRINNSQIVINRIPAVSAKILNKPIMIAAQPQNIKIPPNITIKRTVGGSKHQVIKTIPIINNSLNVIKRPNKCVPKRPIKVPQLKQRKKHVVGEVLTVELDDDEESGTSTSKPKWYICPEDHSAKTVEPNMQKENNQEPNANKMIEITIEDSPIKQIIGKKTELAITIEDSPIKLDTHKGKSDNGDDKSRGRTTEKHSKKKLNYPNTVEIELEPMEITTSEPETAKNKDQNYIIEIEESPYKTVAENPSTPKKSQQPKPILSVDLNSLKDDESEFHPVYQNFIHLCFKLENSEDMKKIVEKKIKTYYRQVPKEYTHSESFVDMVSCKITCMKASPDKMYLYIKDIVDELNLQRKSVKAQIVEAEEKKEEVQNYLYGEDSEFDLKRQRQIRKLEKTLKKLHRAVQKLEEQEVDFDDDEDSVYLLTERYKERMVKVHAKFCQLTNTKMPSEPRVQIDARPGQPSGPAKRLEKWINKKVPIGTPLPFPDFHDVIRCVREANEEDKLGWNEVDIMEEEISTSNTFTARDLFTRCGKKLQRRRQENEWRSAASRISVDIDPAENDDELKKRLEHNRQVASKKESEVFNKYAIRQSQLNLEPEEIGDKEADESPIESEEEEQNDENNSLENKEKRKERLRRLLQQKSKQSQSTNDLKDANKISEQPENDVDVEMTQADSNNDKDPLADADKIELDEINKDRTNSPAATSSKNIENSDDNDENDRIDSDIDELHLLQKLHSENEVSTSTHESSESESQINISDTLGSSSDIENKHNSCSEVISIENSSYSESEIIEESIDQNPKKAVESAPKEVEHVMDMDVEMECSNDGIEKHQVHSNNEEYCEPVEDILLASSDDEGIAKTESCQTGETFINTKDDTLSIGSTIVEGADQNNDVATADENSQDVTENTDNINKNETNFPEKNACVSPVTDTEKGDDVISTQSECVKISESIEEIAIAKSSVSIDTLSKVVLVAECNNKDSVGVVKDGIVKDAKNSCASVDNSTSSEVTESGLVDMVSPETVDTNLNLECTKALVAISNETEVH